MHPKMSQQTREEVLQSLRVRYVGAGLEYRSKMIDQVVELLGYNGSATSGMTIRWWCRCSMNCAEGHGISF
jgi:hypothetical protein